MNKFFFSYVAMATLLTATVACSDDNDEKDSNNNGGGDVTPTLVEKYVVAASSTEAVYLLDTDDLTSGNISYLNNTGVEAETATAWLFHSNKYAYRLVYNQGNAGTGSSYILNSAGNLEERNIRFEIGNRFTTYGTYDKYVITAASGATSYFDEADTERAFPKYGVTFTYLNVEEQTQYSKTVVTENLVDNNGEFYTVSGLAESKGKLFTALCPQGYSAYGVNKGHADIDAALVNFPDLVSATGTIATTLHPNRVWVAIYNDIDFDNPKIISDDRLSFATSRRQSQFYSTISATENEDIYVFSASNAKNYAAPHNTELASGVLRIKAGEEQFDQHYYYNIEELSGGRHVYRVTYITADLFLLRMYSNPGETSANTQPTLKLAIFNAANGDFTWITNGLPSEEAISDFGLMPYAEDGKVYVPVITNDGSQPTIYVIDPISSRSTATPGIIVTAASVSAVGKLTN